MSSLKDIAERAGTSIATVSLTLHGKNSRRRVSPEKEELIRKIAKELNYLPNAAARMMLSKKSGQIGIVIRNAPDKPMHNPPNYEIIVGIADKLADSGCLPVIIPLKLAGDKLEELRVFKERLLDGILFMDSVPEAARERIGEAVESCVFVESEWRKENCVRRDEAKTGRIAARKLLEAGCERLVYFGLKIRPGTHYSIIERPEGAQAACEEAGAEFSSLTVRRPDVECPVKSEDPIDYHMEFLENIRLDAPALLPLLQGKRTGVLAYNSNIAHAAYSVLAGRGLLPGRDYLLAACDTCFEMELNWPELSCCSFNRYKTGQLAAEMLLKSIDGGGPQKSLKMQPVWKPGSTAKGC